MSDNLTSAEWVAKIRASERAERDAKDQRWEEEARAVNASVCAGCGRRWLTVMAARPKPPVFIHEADAHWHWICWQRRLEAKR